MYADEARALKAATPRILASAFRAGGLEFGAIFATDSPDQRAQRGGRFLKFDTRTTSWRDAFTGTTGAGVVSFIAYAKAISQGAALALCKRSCSPNDHLDGHRTSPITLQSDDEDEPDDDTVTKLAKRRMSPTERRDALIQSVKDTLHSQFDKKRR